MPHRIPGSYELQDPRKIMEEAKCRRCLGFGTIRYYLPIIRRGIMLDEGKPALTLPAISEDKDCPTCGGHGNTALRSICIANEGPCVPEDSI